ncbi:MAG: DUF3592 domain-containing protein [Planctomycetota bacterium]
MTAEIKSKLTPNERRTMWLIMLPVAFTFAVIVGMVGYFDVQAIREYQNSRLTLLFEQAEGTIEVADVQNVVEDGVTSYEARFEYSYFVDARKYQGHSQDDFRKASMGYPEDWDLPAIKAGSTVPVYYDADDPANATLVQGVSSSFTPLVVILLPFNLLAIYLVWLSVKFLWKFAVGAPTVTARN